MVGVARRMNKLKALLDIRHGLGAAILPSNVTRIHLEFSKKWNNGQFGARKFWQSYLPRLKYWNPAIPIVINRTNETDGPATLTIYFQKAAASGANALNVTPELQPSSSFLGTSPAPSPTPAEHIIQLDVKTLRSEAILQDFLAKTGAVAVTPLTQEIADMREVEERAGRADIDREAMRKYRDAQKREAALLAQAQSEIEALKQNA